MESEFVADADYRYRLLEDDGHEEALGEEDEGEERHGEGGGEQCIQGVGPPRLPFVAVQRYRIMQHGLMELCTYCLSLARGTMRFGEWG